MSSIWKEKFFPSEKCIFIVMIKDNFENRRKSCRHVYPFTAFYVSRARESRISISEKCSLPSFFFPIIFSLSKRKISLEFNFFPMEKKNYIHEVSQTTNKHFAVIFLKKKFQICTFNNFQIQDNIIIIFTSDNKHLLCQNF